MIFSRQRKKNSNIFSRTILQERCVRILDKTFQEVNYFLAEMNMRGVWRGRLEGRRYPGAHSGTHPGQRCAYLGCHRRPFLTAAK